MVDFAALRARRAEKRATKPNALVNVAVVGSYMLNPLPGWLARQLRDITGLEDLSRINLLVTDSKGVASAARDIEGTHGRVFAPSESDGAAMWRKRTERMVAAADHALIVTSGSQGMDNNESAFFVQLAKAAQLPMKIVRL